MPVSRLVRARKVSPSRLYGEVWQAMPSRASVVAVTFLHAVGLLVQVQASVAVWAVDVAALMLRVHDVGSGVETG